MLKPIEPVKQHSKKDIALKDFKCKIKIGKSALHISCVSFGYCPRDTVSHEWGFKEKEKGQFYG
jgi:hypothetical protein